MYVVYFVKDVYRSNICLISANNMSMIQKHKFLTFTGLALVILLIMVSSVTFTVGAQPSSGDTPYRCFDNGGNLVACPSASTYNFEIGGCYRVVPENQGRTFVENITCPDASSGSNPGSGSSPGSASTSIEDDTGRLDSEFDDSDDNCTTDNGEALNSENCGIIELLVDGINILSALAVMAIIASIVMAGYQYMTARDNSGQIQKARMRIIWALSALALFVFMYAILNFLIPGGVF